MDSEIDFDLSPFFILYKNGRFERLPEQPNVPPSQEPQNDVVSKDIVISPETNLSLRIFLPHKTLENNNNNKKKLPLLVYFHGGCFIFYTAFNQIYNTFVTSAVLAADCIAVSVDYRRAPEHPIPTAYEDSWEALKWVFSHINGSGPEPWLNQYADFNKVFLAGDSAGANISHHLTIKAGKEKSEGIKILGIILVHPYFWSKTPIDEEDTKDVEVRKMYEKLWEVASPNSEEGVDDPWFNVVGSDTDISGLGCERVLVMVAGKDVLVRQGYGYVKKLVKSGWGGKVEVFESEGEIHVFHLKNPDSYNARKFVERFAEFVKDGTS